MIRTKRRKGGKGKEKKRAEKKERKKGERKDRPLAWHIGFQISFYPGVKIMSTGSHLSPSLGRVFYLMDFKLRLCKA